MAYSIVLGRPMLIFVGQGRIVPGSVGCFFSVFVILLLVYAIFSFLIVAFSFIYFIKQ